MKKFFVLSVCALSMFAITGAAQAATPEEIQEVIKTLEESHLIIGYRERELILQPFELKVLLGLYTDNKNETLVLSVGDPTDQESTCMFHLADAGLDGIVDVTDYTCGGISAQLKFFSIFGGAQKFYDTVIRSALPQNFRQE